MTDAAAVQQFNTEAAAYSARNATQKAVAQELDSARKELEGLLDERSKRMPAKRP